MALANTLKQNYHHGTGWNTIIIQWIILHANLSASLISHHWHWQDNCLSQDFTDMSDTCKGCEKRSIFALKRHQRAEQAWHQRISAQLCLSELGSPWPTSSLNDCVECPWWMAAILHLMLAGDTRVSECQEENPPHPTCRGPWHSFRTKAWPAVDTHSQSCGWLARPRLCLPWNWKLLGPFLMTNHFLYVFSSPWRWGTETTFWWSFVADLATNFH